MKPLIIVVDEKDNIIGYKSRDLVERLGLRYRVAALWIKNSKGKILMARRGYNKNYGPGKWSAAAAGTVEKGESYKLNIIKEAEEEIGLRNISIKKGPKIKYDGKYKYFVQWFICIIDKPIESFKIQKEEVAEIKWISKENLKKLSRNNPEKFVGSVSDCLKLNL